MELLLVWPDACKVGCACPSLPTPTTCRCFLRVRAGGHFDAFIAHLGSTLAVVMLRKPCVVLASLHVVVTHGAFASTQL